MKSVPTRVDALRLHQLERRRRRVIAVLDRGDAALRGDLRSGVGGAVRRDLDAPGRGLLHERAHVLDRVEVRLVVHRDLGQLRAEGDVLADGLADLVGRVRVEVFRDADVGALGRDAVVLAAVRPDDPAGVDDRGTGNEAVLDGAPQGGVRVVAGIADVAHRREPARSMSRAFATPSIERYAVVSIAVAARSVRISAFRPLPPWVSRFRQRCVCMSKKPGITVFFDRSTTVAFFGIATDGPTAVIFPASTRMI